MATETCNCCGQEIRRCKDCNNIIKNDERVTKINREDFDTTPHTFSTLYQCEECWNVDEASWYDD